MRATWPAHLILLDFICLMILGWVQITKFPIMQLFPFSCYFIPLRFKYSHQHLFSNTL
jgi:hypothetical protein